MEEDNLLLMTDSYKQSHWKQYPEGTTSVYSYFESRGGEFPETVFFGLQYFIKRYLEGQVVTKEKIDEAESYFKPHMGIFNRKGWEYIFKVHGGKLPVRLKAVPEGTIVPVKNVLMTIENTDPNCFWLTNFLETILVQVWYPTTVATISRECKKVIANYLAQTSESLDGLPFKLHDFGCRGVSSMESAGIGGAAHLVNFMGTDTVPALVVARKYYGENMAGYSIPAAEHSTITSWGRNDELAAFNNMLTQYPSGLVAVVSDSYDIYNACTNLWGGKLKTQVIGRNGCVVVRPDSGEPTETVPEILRRLWTAFGGTTNSKGHKLLDPHIRVIQGDGVNLGSIGAILEAVKKAGFSTDNLAFGMGGALLQQLNRDTQRFAFKASHVVVNGEGRDVYKQPVTDSGKTSKRGKFSLIHGGDGSIQTVPYSNYYGEEDMLRVVLENGVSYNNSTLAEIRAKASL
jgi:nicotinamide phosphoribosyltransferase